MKPSKWLSKCVFLLAPALAGVSSTWRQTHAGGPTLSTIDLCSVLGPTCINLAQSLVGPNIVISNVQCRAACRAAGLFQGGAGVLGFESGVVLGTGSIAEVAGPNDGPHQTTGNAFPGDPRLDPLASGCGVDCLTRDATILEFDFQFAPGCQAQDTISFQYVFASDEYHEYLNDPLVGTYNDVFAFFLNGVNIARLPGTISTPVSIGTVNCGWGDTSPCGHCPFTYRDCPPYGGSNCVLLRNNQFDPPVIGTCNSVGPGIDTEMDALTIVLTASGPVDTAPGAINHIVLGIADVRDQQVDSNVFLKSASIVCQRPTGACCDSAGGTCTENVLEEDCAGQWYAGIDCAHVHPPCKAPRMLVLLDRTGSMNAIRVKTGNTRCFDALQRAKDDVTEFFTNHSNGRVAVWTFNGAEPTPRTNGFVDQAAALPALNDPSAAVCQSLTPLAESMCEAADALTAQLADPSVGDLFLAVSSDGQENHSDGECAGPHSTAGTTNCGQYDALSWQKKVCDKLIGAAVVMARYWGSLQFTESSGMDQETGQLQGGAVSDYVFFQSLAEASGGRFDLMDDAAAPPTGACCDDVDRCRGGLTSDACAAIGGAYLGDGTDCSTVLCSPRPVVIPTLSEWGVIAMTLLLLVSGTVILARQHTLPM